MPLSTSCPHQPYCEIREQTDMRFISHLTRNAPGACQELTRAMHAMAQAKLRLASGSACVNRPYAVQTQRVA